MYLSSMLSTHMAREMRRLSKALPTFLTRVRFLSSVSSDVMLQIFSTMFGRVWTMRALVYLSLIGGMLSTHMGTEMCRPGKALPTFLTRVWLLSSVSSDVTLQNHNSFEG